MSEVKSKLYDKIADFFYGKFEPAEDKEEYKKSLNDFRSFIAKWKIDQKTKMLYGPLRPPEIYQRTYGISQKDIVEIAQSFNLDLPETWDLSEYNIDQMSDDEIKSFLQKMEKSEDPEEIILDLLTARESAPDFSYLEKDYSPQSFDFLDITKGDIKLKNVPDTSPAIIRQIAFLQDTIEKIKSGEIVNFTAITLQDDDKAQLWIPTKLDDHQVSELYDPLLNMLKEARDNDDLPD